MTKRIQKNVIYMIYFLWIFMLCICSTVSAETYRTSNADQISDAMKKAIPGDTIILNNGTWTDQEIKLDGDGTEEQPILIRAEDPGMVFITGESNLRISGTWMLISGLRFQNGTSPGGAVIEFRNESRGGTHHCRLTECIIANYNPIDGNEYKWISLYGSYNRVDHCTFYGKQNRGTLLVVWMSDEPDYHLIDHNYFLRRPPMDVNGAETIRVGTSDYSMNSSYTVVEYNVFEDCDGEVEIISNKSCDNIYRYNTFYGCQGSLTLRHGNRNTVHNNFFFGRHEENTGGVRIIGEDQVVYNNYFQDLDGSDFYAALPIMNGVPNSPLNRYFQVKRAKVVHNTIVNCTQPLVIGLGKDSERNLPPEDCIIANNVVKTDYNVFTIYDEPLNMEYAGNIVHGSALGKEDTVGIQFINPKLIFENDSLWRLTEESPCIDAASGDYPFILDDMDGQLRNTLKDIGADEYSFEVKTHFPLKKEDVGASWYTDPELVYGLGIHIEGSGRVSMNPSGGFYKPGTMVTLTAIPEQNAWFDRWSGDLVSNENPAVVSVDRNLRITANFDEPQHYSVFTWINGSGWVEVSPVQETYLEGSKVIATAIPDDGWKFREWSGALRGILNPDTLIIEDTSTIIATFVRLTGLSINTPVPMTNRLHQNFPNPFNPVTSISFTIANPGLIRLMVYNLGGQKVADLVNGEMEAGHKCIQFDASNLSSGIYLYRLQTQDYSETRKMIIEK